MALKNGSFAVVVVLVSQCERKIQRLELQVVVAQIYTLLYGEKEK